MEKAEQISADYPAGQSVAWRALWLRLLSKVQEDRNDLRHPSNTFSTSTDGKRYSQLSMKCGHGKCDGGSDDARG